VEFSGTFETHLTVEPTHEAAMDGLRAIAARYDLKLTHVVLHAGRSASQPMLTRHGEGDDESERREIKSLIQRLEAEGLHITRVKIEVAPDSHGVPDSAEEASRSHAGTYFEHHVKVLVESLDALSRLLGIAQAHDARLSRNALRIRPDARQERFCTQRCFRMGRTGASVRLRSLVRAITAESFEVLETVQEFVIYDSNLALDEGWLDGGAS
jgi:hypothetical protein